MQLDDLISDTELNEARECLERRNCVINLEEFQKDFVRAMAAYRAGGGNYRADDDTFPGRVWFENGRTVGIAFDGDKPYLTIGKYDKNSGAK